MTPSEYAQPVIVATPSIGTGPPVTTVVFDEDADEFVGAEPFVEAFVPFGAAATEPVTVTVTSKTTSRKRLIEPPPESNRRRCRPRAATGR
ncbi:hypothetical protein EFA46_007420 [Halarchaeum sp. CBA1220]|uniref:hypothetical protein n=1 Tax=Halarchaeum sp. CBA1220 TaxID=1853682 RepID=UPI0011CD67BB|nr:hypothetical protein [Halarchaeum sp. CBA1220]QLC34038.1 hypothetical protein EFA46_007420 [Halarchaeum sp. CBA1220]